MERLKRRQDFLAAARAKSLALRGAVVQCRERGQAGPARIGFTVTSKLGNAVVRNRIRRRLKEAVRTFAADKFLDGRDYVVIGRNGTIDRPFDALKNDIGEAVDRLNSGEGRSFDKARSRQGRKNTEKTASRRGRGSA